MHRNILIPTDGSELSAKAVEHGVALARETNAAITFVTVASPFHSMSGEPHMAGAMPEEYRKFVHDYLTAESEAHLAAAKAIASAAGVRCETCTVQNDHVYQGIIDTAEAKGCDLILMSSHGRRGLSAMVLGSETMKVLTHSKIPVLVYR